MKIFFLLLFLLLGDYQAQCQGKIESNHGYLVNITYAERYVENFVGMALFFIKDSLVNDRNLVLKDLMPYSSYNSVRLYECCTDKPFLVGNPTPFYDSLISIKRNYIDFYDYKNQYRQIVYETKDRFYAVRFWDIDISYCEYDNHYPGFYQFPFDEKRGITVNQILEVKKINNKIHKKLQKQIQRLIALGTWDFK